MADIPEKQNGVHDSLPTLGDWFGGPAGSVVSNIEHALVRRALANLFGYHIAQLGNHYARSLLEASRIPHRVVVTTDHDARAEGAQLACASDALPLESNSLDVLVLPHTLDLTRNAHGVLREAERVLIGEGHVVLLGFSPWSIFGLWRLGAGWRGAPPWSGRFYGVARVKDWLELLGFEILCVERASFRPPLRRSGLHRRLQFLERFGAYFWPMLGNVYLIRARKRVEGVRPIRLALTRRERRLPASGVVKPTARQPPPQRRTLDACRAGSGAP